MGNRHRATHTGHHLTTQPRRARPEDNDVEEPVPAGGPATPTHRPHPQQLRNQRPRITAGGSGLNGQRLDAATNAQLRAELDALMFHLYGISRDDASYILDTFPIVKRKDEAKYGDYRTKHLILAAFDQIDQAR